MNERHKISVRKVMQMIVTIIVTTACIMGITSADNMENKKTISSITVQIKNDSYRFLDQQQVLDMLVNNRHVDIRKVPLGRLDIKGIEKIVSSSPWVQDAQVYVDKQQNMRIVITQRVPVARIFEANGNSYYLDTSLSAMPLSRNYVYYTTVVTNMPELRDDSLSMSLKSQVVKLVKYIEADTFWNAQVSQIIMDSDYTFELTPVIGNQRILIGDTSRLKEKLDNLLLFYKNVLDKIGWDKYSVLDVRYKGQIVASPSLPWKQPVDKAMQQLGWAENLLSDGETEIGSSNAAEKKLQPVAQPKEQKKSQIAHVTIMPHARPKPDIKAVMQKKVQEKKQHKKNINREQNNKQITPKYLYQGNK